MMTGEDVPAPQQGNFEEPMDAECPICYQEYNQYNKFPQMLECLHVFCAECLQRIQIRPSDRSDPNSPKAIACPLCRHLTLLDAGDALSLPCNSRILSRLPPAASVVSTRKVNHLSSVPQEMVFSLEDDSRDSGFIIVPTVSLRVQQMHPDRPCGAAPGLVGEEGVIQQSKRTLGCVQVLAVIFWVLFVITCVFGVVQRRF